MIIVIEKSAGRLLMFFYFISFTYLFRKRLILLQILYHHKIDIKYYVLYESNTESAVYISKTIHL